MAPGACQACQSVGKTLDGKPRRVAKDQRFATDVGPKITNKDDPERRREIPEEYRQIFYPPLHPHCMCSLKPIFVPLDGTVIRFDSPFHARSQYIPGNRPGETPDLAA